MLRGLLCFHASRFPCLRVSKFPELVILGVVPEGFQNYLSTRRLRVAGLSRNWLRTAMTAVEPPGEALPDVLVHEGFPELLVREPGFQKVSIDGLQDLSRNWLRIVNKTAKSSITSFLGASFTDFARSLRDFRHDRIF